MHRRRERHHGAEARRDGIVEDDDQIPTVGPLSEHTASALRTSPKSRAMKAITSHHLIRLPSRSAARCALFRQVAGACNMLGGRGVGEGMERSGPVVESVSFEAFCRSAYPGALRLAWLLTRDGPASEDVVQDALGRLQARYGRVDRPEAYLRSMVVNRCRDLRQRASREDRRLRLVEAGRPTSAGPPGEPLIDALDRLTSRQKAALVLRYWADLPDADIAAALGVRPATVRSLLARGLAALREEFPDGI